MAVDSPQPGQLITHYRILVVLAFLPLLHAQQPDPQIARLEKLIQTDPTNAGAHAMLGQIHLDARRPEKALRHLEIAVKLKPADPATVFLLGVAQLETGRDAQAFDTFSKLAARAPADVATKAYLVRAALRVKKADVARANLSALRRLAPNEGLLHAQVAEWCAAEEGAEASLEQIRFTLGLPLPALNQARV